MMAGKNGVQMQTGFPAGFGTRLADDEAGLVISNPMKVSRDSLEVTSSQIDAQELRFSLLFWDKLVWPDSAIFHFPNNDDAHVLEAIGLMERPRYSIGGAVGGLMIQTHYQAFKDMELREPGRWAMSLHENALNVLDKDAFDHEAGILVELHKAVPIPRADVSLYDVLEFKYKRRPELLALRTHLRSFAADISESGREDALKARISEIDAACSDLLKVGKEWQCPIVLSNVKASLNLSYKPIVAAFGGWAAGMHFGLTAATACAAIAGVDSAISIKRDIGYRPFRAPRSPFRYAYSAFRELR